MQLVIGTGEIGKAIANVLGCKSHDIEPIDGQFDILHICFPYSDSFNGVVKSYRERYKAKYVVIHSTVPVGTSSELNAIHSPVNGKHPDLEQSIRTFTKVFAGEGADVVASHFKDKGCKVKVFSKPENTEAGKLWSLNIYGLNILIQKEIYAYCKAKGLDFDEVYTEYVDIYNNGYSDMGLSQFQMYKLENSNGKIGGHCIIDNQKHLDSELADYLVKWNNKL